MEKQSTQSTIEGLCNVVKAGFVATIGRPNSGKSTLLNAIVGENLALVSKKANATRKRLNLIVPYKISDDKEAQIIFVDTPGIHKQEKLINQFMLNEALKAQSDCDLVMFVAPATDDIKYYEEFLQYDKKHILVLSKTDLVNNEAVLKKINEYKKYDNKFISLVPLSSLKSFDKNALLRVISGNLPTSPALFDTDILTNSSMREIYKELIREAVFNNVSDELPYESDIKIEKVIEGEIEKIYALIVVEKESQKGILIGKNAATIKRIGIDARRKIEELLSKKVFLKLNVFVQKGWSKKKENLKKFGYDFLS